MDANEKRIAKTALQAPITLKMARHANPLGYQFKERDLEMLLGDEDDRAALFIAHAFLAVQWAKELHEAINVLVEPADRDDHVRPFVEDYISGKPQGTSVAIKEIITHYRLPENQSVSRAVGRVLKQNGAMKIGPRKVDGVSQRSFILT